VLDGRTPRRARGRGGCSPGRPLCWEPGGAQAARACMLPARAAPAAGCMMRINAAGGDPHEGMSRSGGRRAPQGSAAGSVPRCTGARWLAPSWQRRATPLREQQQGAAAGTGRALVVGFVDVAALPDLLQHRAHHSLPARRARLGYRSRCWAGARSGSSLLGRSAGKHAPTSKPGPKLPDVAPPRPASPLRLLPCIGRRRGSAARASCLASVVRMKAS